MKARIVWLVLCGIWGSTWMAIKVGLRDLPPLSFAGIRFVLAVLLVYGVIRARRVALPTSRRDWGLIALTGGLAFSVNYGLLFWGEQHISSGLAALLQATIPAFGYVFAHAMLPGERVTPGKVAGVALGIFGVGVIFSNQLSFEGTAALLGGAAIVAGAVACALANVLVKGKCGHLDPAVLAGGQMVCGLVPLLAAGMILEGNPLSFRWTWSAVGCLVYLAVVGSALAFLLYYWLVRNMEVTTTMLIALVTPMIAVAAGVVFLGEVVTVRSVAGGACIVGGIALINVRRRRGGLSGPLATAGFDAAAPPRVRAVAASKRPGS